MGINHNQSQTVITESGKEFYRIYKPNLGWSEWMELNESTELIPMTVTTENGEEYDLGVHYLAHRDQTWCDSGYGYGDVAEMLNILTQ